MTTKHSGCMMWTNMYYGGFDNVGYLFLVYVSISMCTDDQHHRYDMSVYRVQNDNVVCLLFFGCEA